MIDVGVGAGAGVTLNLFTEQHLAASIMGQKLAALFFSALISGD